MAEIDPQELGRRRQRLRDLRDGAQQTGSSIAAAGLEASRARVRQARETARSKREEGASPADLLPQSAAPKIADQAVAASAANEASTGDRSKRTAAMLLSILRGGAGDGSAKIPGTTFTEAGAEKFVATIKEKAGPDGKGGPFFERIYKMCTKPAAEGETTFKGSNLAGLTRAAALLEQIQSEGLEQMRRKRGAPNQGAAGPGAGGGFGAGAGLGRGNAGGGAGLLRAMGSRGGQAAAATGPANQNRETMIERVARLEQVVKELKAKLGRS